MLDDLVENHLPPGMPENDVIELLGEPTTRYSAELIWEDSCHNHYWRYGDPKLSIHFNDDRTLRHAALYID